VVVGCGVDGRAARPDAIVDGRRCLGYAAAAEAGKGWDDGVLAEKRHNRSIRARERQMLEVNVPLTGLRRPVKRARS